MENLYPSAPHSSNTFRTKLYSPRQVNLITFFGGPLAAVYVVRENFLALGKQAYARNTLMIGLIVSVLIAILALVLPEGFPPVILPAMYMFVGYLLTKKHFLSKETIESSDQYELRSVGQSVVVCLLGFIAFFVLGMALALVLPIETPRY